MIAPGLLLLAAVLLFVPLAAASTEPRAAQTLAVAALVFANVGFAAVWLALRGRGLPRPAYLAAGALIGALLAFFPVAAMPELDGGGGGASNREILAALLVDAAAYAAGLWALTLALRRLFPAEGRRRAAAAAAFALVLVGLVPGPTLLLQPSAAALRIGDVRPQIPAGFLYWTVGAALLVLPLLALTTLPGDWFERWWERATRRVMSIPIRWFMIGAAAVAFALALVFAFYSFGGAPTTSDEIAQLWHARILLTGRLALPADPNPEFFAIDNIVDSGRWMSQFPIGGPAVMAVGVLLGVPWLLNPIFTGLTVRNVYRFTQRAYGEALARAATILFVASPMVLLMGASHMNHAPTVWLVTTGLAALPAWLAAADHAQLRRSAALIGLVIGCATAIRPLDGVIAGSVIGMAMLAAAARDRVRARTLAAAILAGAIPVAILLVANWQTTGQPLRFAYEMLWGENHSLGLHDDPVGNPHTPWRALLLATKYTTQLNLFLTAWPVPVVLVLAAGLFFLRAPRRWDTLLLALFGAQLAAYAFYWHDGQFVGPRFLFTAAPALLILVARSPFIIAEHATVVGRRVVLATIPVCIAVSWLRPMEPFGVQGLAKGLRETRSRFKIDTPEAARAGRLSDAVIFVQEGASARLQRRLWGLGVSRPDAATLLARADGCALLEAARAEEQRPRSDSAGRLNRIQAAARSYRESPGRIVVPDPNFRVSDSLSVTPACGAEIAHDLSVLNTVAYGPMLLHNRLDDSGRIAGPVVYVIDLRERNEALRERFADRDWYRYEVPLTRADSTPVLVPYASPR